jgi:hypothetical protein
MNMSDNNAETAVKDRGGRGHKAEKIGTLVLFLLNLIVLAGFMPMDAGFFRGVAEDALRDMGADSVSIGSISVVLFTGLRAKGIDTYKRISDNGDGYRTHVAAADVRCNLVGAALALVAGPNRFKGGRDVFREAYERPFELAGDASRAAVSLRSVKRITLRGAGIAFTGNGTPGISASGAEVTLGRSGVDALSGNVTVKETVIPALAKVDNFKVKMSVDDKKLELADGGGTVFGGKLRMSLSVDVSRSKVLSGEAFLKGLDLRTFCAGTGFSPGGLSGKVDINARVEGGSPIRLDSVKANGRVTVKNLTAAELALQKTPIVTQLSRDLQLLRFSEVKGGFALAGGKLHFKEITGAGDVLNFRSAGWVGLDGKMSQDFEGELNAGFVAGLPKLVRNSLEKTESDGGRFKCKISGTFHKPRIEVDRSVYNRAIGGFFKDLFK